MNGSIQSIELTKENKFLENTKQKYRGHFYSVNCVTQISEVLFATGSYDK